MTVSTIESADLLPVRMLSEYSYCPRLFHLMHVEGRWEDNEYTLEGKEAHRRVDKRNQPLPDVTEGDDPPAVSRSVNLGSNTLGLVGKLDLVETQGTIALPVETKRGRVPANPERSWEPERVQLMAQALLLREHGYQCDRGILYYAGSRTRVEIPLTTELEDRTLQLLEEARVAATATLLPAPLEDSPKCRGCSLSGICLPDETLALQARLALAAAEPVEVDDVPNSDDVTEAEEGAEGEGTIRRLFPPRSSALPLYVQEQGARVGKRGERLVVTLKDEALSSVPLKDVSQVVLLGNISISAQTIHLLCESGVPVVHLSMGHWFYGVTSGMGLRNSYDRAAQYQAAADPARRLAFARAVVAGKGANQRTMLSRNVRPRPV